MSDYDFNKVEITDEMLQKIIDGGQQQAIRADWGFLMACEIQNLRAELERVKAENEWHKYIDGDTSTYPNNDGLIFQIIYGVDGNEWEGHAFYGFVHGWSTDKNVLWYRSVPNTPTAPEEG